MITIWKYPLTLHDNQIIDIPEGAMITDFRHQYEEDSPTFWAIVDTEAKMIKWEIFVFGTGHVSDIINYKKLGLIGSLPFDKGDFVWHFFYKEIK